MCLGSWAGVIENKLALPEPRTNYLNKCFSYSGARLWKSLSSDLRAATILYFKLNIHRHSFELVLTRHPCKAAFSIQFEVDSLVRDN